MTTQTEPRIRHQKKAFDATALVILAVLFLALIVASTFLLRGIRIDLTENQLYTIAPGTKNVLAGLQEPINLYFFFSEQASRDEPRVRAYAQRVREMLEEMAQRSKGKLRLQVIDPQPFTDEEDRATQFGLAAAQVGVHGENFYFGLAGTNSTDGKEIIGFFQPEKEEFLEYDIASLIFRLSNPKRPTIALAAGLPMNESFDQMSGRMREGWAITGQLRELFDVKQLPPDFTSIEAGIDVVMLVHPKNLSPAGLYAIDQFVLRGGKLFAFMDPSSEQDPAGQSPMPGMPPTGGESRSSTLGPLLTAWGVDYDAGKVVGDLGLALTVSMRQGQPPTRHLGVLSLPKANMNSQDVVTGNLDSINMMTVGALKQREGATTKFETLLSSSKETALLDASKFAYLMDPQVLLDGFVSGNEVRTLAARISGKASSAFPNGAPPDAPAGTHLKESTQDINVVLVADTDILADMLWLRVQNLFGQRYAVAWANNGDFVANVLDNLTGSADLISIRGRQSFFRPFKKVDELRLNADQRLRSTEQELNRRLQETESKLQQLQASRQDQGSLSLTPEQQQEITRFQQERGRVRKELRDVRRTLDVGIEQLGWQVKLLNTLLIPALLIAAAIFVAVRRSSRLRASRNTSSQGAAA